MFLSQGVGAGLGLGILFLPTISVISHHFRKYRAIAMGIVFSGSSAGGIVFPIMLNKLFAGPLGFANGVRATVGLIAGTLIVGNLLVRTRHIVRPPGQVKPSYRGLLRDGPYVMSVAALFFLWLGIFFPMFYIQLDASVHGVNQTVSFYMVRPK